MDAIEDCCKFSSTKQLRVLRDLFSSNPKQRGIATHVIKKNWERPEIEDLLKETFEMESWADDVFIELNVYSSGIASYSDYDNMYSIFTNKTESSFKKTAIENLSILINDRSDQLGSSGRRLFREKKKGRDVFSLCIQDLLKIHAEACNYGMNELHPNELNYAQELLRFLALSFLFYFDEPVVNELLRPYQDIEDDQGFEHSTLGTLIDALRLCLSCKQIEIRKNALRCLQIILFNDQVKLWIDMNSGLPYFSVPTYMTNTYDFLFPTVSILIMTSYRNIIDTQ